MASIIKKKKQPKKPNVPLDLNELDKNRKPVNARCMKCNKVKKVSDFYKSVSPNNNSGHTQLCKDCIQQMSLMGTGTFNERAVYDICKQIDKPFKNVAFQKAKAREDLMEMSKIGEYLRMMNQLKNQGLGFKDSEVLGSSFVGTNENPINIEEMSINKSELIKLFGGGYLDQEYSTMWDKYQQLKNNYPEKTAMHKEALIKYCKYSTKEDFSIASGDTASAKIWGDLAAKTATAAKINPSQLSAADLSDGMTCFAQISAMVEREKDIIPLLPKYTDNPLDRVDYVLYMIFDYLQDLEGKPHITYKEIWDFIYKNQDRNKKIFSDEVVPTYDSPSEDAILVEGEV